MAAAQRQDALSHQVLLSPFDQSSSVPDFAWLNRFGAVAAAAIVLLIPISVVAHAISPQPRWRCS